MNSGFPFVETIFLQIRYGAYLYDELSLMAKLFTHDLSDHLRSERLLRDAKIGTKSFVDQSLIPLPCLLGLSLESAKDLIVQVDSDAGLPGSWNHRTPPTLRKVILLFHTLVSPSARPSEPRQPEYCRRDESKRPPSMTRRRSCRPWR